MSAACAVVKASQKERVTATATDQKPATTATAMLADADSDGVVMNLKWRVARTQLLVTMTRMQPMMTVIMPSTRRVRRVWW